MDGTICHMLYLKKNKMHRTLTLIAEYLNFGGHTVTLKAQNFEERISIAMSISSRISEESFF